MEFRTVGLSSLLTEISCTDALQNSEGNKDSTVADKAENAAVLGWDFFIIFNSPFLLLFSQ